MEAATAGLVDAINHVGTKSREKGDYYEYTPNRIEVDTIADAAPFDTFATVFWKSLRRWSYRTTWMFRGSLKTFLCMACMCSFQL
jgi:hypothetical protein